MPGATIVHEPTLFKVQSNPYKVSGTIPDFLITRPDGRRIFVEITISPNNGDGELKKRQKKIIEQLAPDAKYVVLSRENLLAIQKRHPEAQFFP